MKKLLPNNIHVLLAVSFSLVSFLAWAQPTLTFSPVNGATGIAENTTITISSNQDLDRADNTNLTDANILALIRLKINNGSGLDIPFTADFNEATKRSITITPTGSLPSNTIIFVEIKDLEGNGNTDINPNPQSITFTTGDSQAPVVTFNPTNGATNVSLTGNLTISFSEAIRKANDGVLADADLVSPILELKIGSDAGAAVPFTATIDAAKQVITIDPTSDLANNTTYYLEIGGVEDASDNAISPNPTSITFSTPDTNPPVITFTPLNAAVNVNENNNITIAFNETVRRASDDANLDNAMLAALLNVKLTDAAGANIPYTATINGTDDLITIDPTAALPSSAIIYVAITGVEDLSGNLITPNPQSITFTVRDYQPPSPTFNPLNAAVNVSITGNLTITFNEPVRKTNNSALVDADLVSPILELKVGSDAGAAVPFTATIDAAKQVITIDPTSDLANNTTYYLEIGGVEDASDNAISPNPTSITFSTPDTNPPVITFTPLNAAVNVNENNNITIAFNETVRRASDDANLDNAMLAALLNVKLTDAAGANIPYTATINGTDDLITIDPTAALPSSAIIYVAITGVEDLSGNLITPTPQSITFTVRDYQPPSPTFNPLNAAVNVSITGNLTITFNEPVRKTNNSALVDADLVSPILELKVGSDAGAAVPFTATIDAAKQVITIDPTSDLANNTTYYLEIGGVEDASDNAISPNPTSITFSTPDTNPPVITFTPLNAAVNVNENNNITIAFNETVRRASDDANLDNAMLAALLNVKLTDAAGANIPYTATINGTDDLITINPTSALPSSAVIYVAITGVEDLSGNIITPNPQSITFTVRDYQPPVITFNPPNGTLGFPLGGDVVITFDEPVRKADGTPLDVSGILFRRDAIGAGGTTVAFTGTINAAKTQITLDPSSNLLVNRDYFVRLNAIEDESGNETSQITIQFKTVNLTVDAGANDVVCQGESVVLGGSPTVVPSAGFYLISWTSPSGFTSNSANPVVNPAATTTYTVQVQDTDGNIVTDDVTITVNQPTSVADVQIVLDPDSSAYNRDSSPAIALSYNLLNGVTGGSGVFTGTAVNSSLNQFFPNAASIGQNQVTLTYTNTAGCETTVTRNIQVYSPDAYLATIEKKYCVNAPNDNLSIEELPTEVFQDVVYLYRLDEVGNLIQYLPPNSSQGWTLNTSTDQIVLSPNQLSPGKYRFYVLYYNNETCSRLQLVYDPLCLCNQLQLVPYDCSTYYYATPEFEIVPLPDLTMQVSLNNCINDSNPGIILSPTGGTLTLNGGTSGLLLSGGQYFIELSNPAVQTTIEVPSTNSLNYSYTDANNCTNTTSANINIFEVPTLNFDNSPVCENVPKDFALLSGGTTIPAGVTVNRYSWSYGTGFSESLSDINQVVSYDYSRFGPDDYDVRLTVITSDNCIVEREETVTVAPVPQVSFSWENVCNKQDTQFAGVTSLSNAEITSIDWNFGDGEVISLPPLKTDPVNTATTTGTRISPLHKFTLPGSDSTIANTFAVNFRIVSNFSCTKDTTLTIYKFPNVTVTEDNAYNNNFNGVTSEWLSGGQNSSWAWGTPNGVVINSDASGGGKAWVTNLSGLYNTDEKSWVHSPCFDLQNLERPVLSVDRRLLTENKDGAVLQVNTSTSTAGNVGWTVVGAINDGLNWYNKQLIEGAPGGQVAVGWEGATALDSAGWRTAVLALDDYLPPLGSAARKNVRFRIAFGSNNDIPGNEGFAFDNFQINQRSRTVLIEQFTNSGSTNPSPTEPNRRSNAQVNDFINLPKTTNEIVKIQYHLGLPGPNEDQLYLDNPQDANARAAYYGISSTPFTLMDASTNDGLFFSNPGGWAPNEFSKLSLQTAKIEISDIVCTVGADEKLNIQVDFETLQDVPANTIFHVVAVERAIDEVSGSNGETEFTYVMKKMLPNAGGTRYNESLPEGFQGSFSVDWLPKAYHLDSLSFVVFAQNEYTREIYQAKFLKHPQEMSDPGLITDTEDDQYSDRVSVFPNPAKSDINIYLPKTVTKETPFSLTDSFGRIVYQGEFRPGEKNRTVSTMALTDGIYMLQLTTPNGSMAVRKVMVKH